MAEEKSLEAGSLLNDVFLVSDSQMLTDRRGRSYYSLRLNLKGGRDVAAKVWSDNITDSIQRGDGIDALARVEEYQGELQLNLQRYSVIPPDTFDPGAYVRTADIDVEQAFETIFSSGAASLDNPLYKELMARFRDNAAFASNFKTAPAAGSQHHNYRGGLIEHTLEVWKLCISLAENFAGKVDRDLLLVGAALHDVGKIHCYTLISGVSEHTEEGMLVDHIFIGSSMVSNLWDAQIDPAALGVGGREASRSKSLLLHMLLSHHGKREWGAPVLPKTPEAILLHFCDQISATMRNCFDLLDNLPEGEEWTSWLSVMDERRKLFRFREPNGG